MNWAVLALAHHAQGQDERALVWLNKAVMWYGRKRAERPEGELPEEAFAEPPHEGYRAIDAAEARRLWGAR